MSTLTAIKNPKKAALNNSGASEMAKMRQISTIKKHPDFKNLFTIKPHVLTQIKESIQQRDFDKDKPLTLWKEEDALIDGYTRLRAASEVGLFDVPVFERSFASLEEALEYALGVQIGRRNLNDAELIIAVEKLDRIKSGGRKKEEDGTVRGRSSEQLAKKLGTNSRKVEKIRAIGKNADKGTLEAVKRGDMSIESAYKKSRPKAAEIITQPREPDFDPLTQVEDWVKEAKEVFVTPSEETEKSKDMFPEVEDWQEEQPEEEETADIWRTLKDEQGNEVSLDVFVIMVLSVLERHDNWDGIRQIFNAAILGELGSAQYMRVGLLKLLSPETMKRIANEGAKP